MTPEQEKALREPFPKHLVGLLPQPYKKDAQKGDCKVCGKWHGLPAMHLDFVGHAAVTDRLLSVDPEWNWEPLSVDADGLPRLDKFGNLWIKLTIAGVTRLGVGDGPSMKVLIGDALRNGARMFGVAIDLWINGQEDEKQQGEETPLRTSPEPQAPSVDYATPAQIKAIKAATKSLTEEQREALVDGNTVYGIELVKDGKILVTATQADDVLTSLKAAAVGQQEPVEVVHDYAAAGQEPF